MDKKVLAIIGIVCLQLATVWFFKGSFEPEEVTEASKPPQSYTANILRHLKAPSPPQIVASSQPDNVLEPSRDFGQTRYRARAYQASTRSLRTKFRKPKPAFESTYAVVRPEFSDTVIVVKRADYRTPLRADRTVVSKPLEAPNADIRPKKRTFLSRAVPVIKKPYVWIKSLVSKL